MGYGRLQRLRLFLLALAASAAIVGPASWVLWQRACDRSLLERREALSHRLADVRVAVNAALTTRLALLRALAAFAASEPDVSEKTFASFVSCLVRDVPGIRSVELARDNVVSHVYPDSGDAGALGLQLPSGLPQQQRPAFRTALATGREVLDGPVPLVRGGVGVIGRMAVVTDAGAGGKNRIWGMATVILDASTLFHDALESKFDGLRLTIRGRTAAGGEPVLVAGDTGAFGPEAVETELAVPGGTWILRALPAGGFPGPGFGGAWLAGSLVIWLVQGVVFWGFVSWPMRLSRAVREATTALGDANASLERTVAQRTAELVAANATLRQLYDDAPVGIFTSTPAGRYLQANDYFARMYGFDDAAQLLREIVSIAGQMYVDPAERAAMLSRLEKDGRLTGYEARRLRRDGSAIWVSLNIRAVRHEDGTIRHLEGFCTDISEGKAAEARLMDQERHLRTLFDHSPLGLVALDRAGTITHCNRRFLELMETTAQETLGTTVVSDLPAFVRTALEQAFSGKPSFAEGPYVAAPSGRAIHLRTAFNPVQTEGPVTEVIAAMEDITAEREQAASLRLLWAAMEHSPVSIVVTDASGHVKYVNPHFIELTGYSLEDVLDRDPRMWSSSARNDGFWRPLWETIRSGQGWRGELCNRKKDGSPYWENASISPIWDAEGTITHFVAIKQDITETRERAARLRRLKSEFEAIFNASSVGLVHLGPDGHIIRVNPRFAALFGLKSGELDGMSLDAVHVSAGRGAAKRRTLLGQVEAGESVHVEERFRSRDGHMFWASVHGRRIDGDSPAAGSIWSFDDVSARKELEAVREDVERIMRHDLKAPLGTIVALPDLVVSLGPVTEEQRDLLGEIELAGQTMLDQIELSLDLYKMETGTYVPHVQSIDLRHVVGGVVAMLASKAKAAGVAIARPEDGDAVFASANALLTQTMLSNLLANAVEAEPAGSTVTLRLWRENGAAWVAIHNPTPVPADIMPLFFEKYVSRGKPGGNGLGTYSARLMAENQGGAIRLDTGRERGTTVTVSLPLA